MPHPSAPAWRENCFGHHLAFVEEVFLSQGILMFCDLNVFWGGKLMTLDGGLAWRGVEQSGGLIWDLGVVGIV